MEKEPKFNDQYGPEDEKRLLEEEKEDELLEQELMPYVVEKIHRQRQKEGIDEKEISSIIEELKKAGYTEDEANLRENAISMWEQELIDQELEKQKLEKQIRKRLEK